MTTIVAKRDIEHIRGIIYEGDQFILHDGFAISTYIPGTIKKIIPQSVLKEILNTDNFIFDNANN